MVSMTRRARGAWLGAATWIAAGAVGLWAAGPSAGAMARPVQRIGTWLLTPTRTLEADLPGPLAVGDPILDPERRPIGRVAALQDPDGTRIAATWKSTAAVSTWRVTLVLDPEAPAGVEALRPRTCTAAGDGRWVLETLLPEPKRKLVYAEIDLFLKENRPEIERFVRPLAEDAIGHAMAILEKNLSAAVEKRSAEIHAILDSHRIMVKDDLLPVLKRKLGPSAKQKAEPLLREVGRELWDELPMWSLGWSAFVDKLPGTNKTRVDQWWAEFLENKAIPICAKHEGELIKALEELIEEGARDPEVRAALAGATRRLAADPRFKALVRGILEDALVRPFDAAGLMERLWADPAHQQRLRRLEELAGPMFQRIGRKVTTDPVTGRIDPDLARVLRRVVFQKDGQWVELGPPLAEEAAVPFAAPGPAAPPPGPAAPPGAPPSRSF